MLGCGETGPAVSAPDEPITTNEGDPVGVLLDGTSALTLSYRVDGGGLVDEAQRLIMSTSGWTTYSLHGTGDVICSRRGVARTQHLQRADVRALAERLQLDSFPTGRTEAGGGCSDGSLQTVRFGASTMTGRCGGDVPYFRAITSRLAGEIAACGAGTPFAGDVWVRAFSASTFGGDVPKDDEQLPRWPATLSLAAAMNAPADEGLRVSGPDAARLRELRDARAVGGLGANDSPTPVRDANGTPYFFLAVDASF